MNNFWFVRFHIEKDFQDWEFDSLVSFFNSGNHGKKLIEALQRNRFDNYLCFVTKNTRFRIY